ncbi:cytochrome c3 family protein [Desulfosporosinus sp. BG]|uniref:cytochrome c3 family protein n=1 Tax=Desulfosporosinus sp. BG TaxID=1633135 RepID=UPI00083AE0A5|nr:cytochrome c3 family protein [Desulfosporosinus sp. BG]ODA41993.1 putative cytochrome c [Desulfosporosinus sp. BG]
MKKRFLGSVLGLTMVLSLSIVGVAFAANTSGDGTNTAGGTYPIQYPVGDQVPGNDLTTTISTTDAAHDNGLINANQTGVGVGTNDGTTATSVAKVKPKERVHGEYQNNTDSCASCHQTHTAAGDNLTFKDGVYDTCIACHDGTLGVLNVFQGSTAGTFGGNKAGNASMHLSTGAMETKAAPGGNHQNTSSNVDGGTGWNSEFNCASCHSPHGSYSDRLLNYNPNGIGSTDMYFEKTVGTYLNADGTTSTGNVPVKSGGLKVVGATVYTTLPATTAVPVDVIAYRTTAGDATLGANPVSQEASSVPVIVLMKKSGTTWVRDITPWINDSAGSGKYTTFTNFYDASKAKLSYSPNPTTTTDLILKLGYAYVKDGLATGLTKVATVDISRAVVVKFDFSSIDEGNFNGIPVKQVDINSYAKAGYGVQIANFCAACHTDYLAKSGTQTGVWSQAFRHTTTSDTYTCLKCHFAHGTDVTVMLDSKDQSVATLSAPGGQFAGDVAGATNYLLDVNPSSALKRYTNMSVCWKCHTSSHSGDFINNEWVQGGVSSGVNASTEYNTGGTSLPTGWVDPNATTLPYGTK